MPLPCAPSCLTRLAVSVVVVVAAAAAAPQRNLGVKARAMVGSERFLSSNSSSNNRKRTKGVDDVVDFQGFRDDPRGMEKLPTMTVQQLRALSRSLGIPARGSKHHLLLALKHFLENEKDEQNDPVTYGHGPSEIKLTHSGCTSSRTTADNSYDEESALNSITISEVSQSGQKRRRGKAPSVDEAKIKVNSRTNIAREKLSTEVCGTPAYFLNPLYQYKHQLGLNSDLIDALNQVVAKLLPDGYQQAQALSELKFFRDATGSFGSPAAQHGLKNTHSDTTQPPDKKRGSSFSGKEDDLPNDGVGLLGHINEPWTVLAHKKPLAGWIPYNPRTMRSPPLADGTKFLKLISWNVNGLRALLKMEGVFAFATKENFDVLCLQETKLQERDVAKIKDRLIAGYENSFWTCSVSKLGYSGTAVISRIKPLSVRYGLGIIDHDTEGRLVTVEFDAFYLISGYVPNSGDGLKRLTYRVTEWDTSLSNYIKELEKSKPVILTGDLNCAHQEIDIYDPAGNRRSAGFTDEERKSFETNFLSKGFIDTFRRQHPGVVGYTYWGYRHGGRKTNKGWRLDYFLVSESIADNVHDSYILPEVTGSDHCPIGLVIRL